MVNQSNAGGSSTAGGATGQIIQGANGTQYVIRQAVQGPQLVQAGNVQQLHVGVQQLQQLNVGHLQSTQQTTQQLVTTQPQQQANGPRIQQQRLIIRTPSIAQPQPQQTTNTSYSISVRSFLLIILIRFNDKIRLIVIVYDNDFVIVDYVLQQSQFNEAQEMFKNSNKVTRSEKALILGFIAGKRREYFSLMFKINI